MLRAINMGVVGLFALAIVGLFGTYAKAATIDVCPGDDVQTKITTSQPGDTLFFNSGTYNPTSLTQLKPSRDYYFDGVVWNGSDNVDERAFVIWEGGNINISGDLTINHVEAGVVIDNTPYDNINISGVTFQNLQGNFPKGIYYYNIKSAQSLLKNGLLDLETERPPAINVRECVFDGGDTAIRYNSGGQSFDSTSPYAIASNNTAVGLSNVMMQMPKATINVALVVLGNDSNSNAVIGGVAFTQEDNYQYFNSPTGIAQKDLSGTYLITGVDYGKGPYDGENCFIADNNDFCYDGITPARGGRLDLGNGKYIGANPLKYSGNLNLDGKVDLKDYAIGAELYKSEQNKALYWISKIAQYWLYIEIE